MSTEIFTLIQTQANNNQAQLNNNHVQESQAQPGLFESLINGLTIKNELINIDSEIMNSQQVMPQNFSFKNNDSFPESIINILADMKHESNLPEISTKPENFIAQILNDENIKSQINSLPEEKQQEILQAVNEFINSNQENIDSQKLFNVLSENINLTGKFQEFKPVLNPEVNDSEANFESKPESESESQHHTPEFIQANINNNDARNINAQITNAQQVTPQNFLFKNNDSFPESIINILADMKHESNLPEISTKPENFIAQILNDENIKSQINSLPEEKQQEILQAVNEFIVNTRQNIDVQAQKLFNVLSENINLPGKFQEFKPVLNPEINDSESKSESDSESESESESKHDTPENIQANINNFAVMPNSVNIQENNIDSSANNEPAKNIIHITPHKNSQGESDSPAKLDADNNIRPVKSFEELTREINNEPESEPESNNNQANNNQDSNQQNFNGNNNNFTSSRSNSRAINDSRKISQNTQSNNQSERANNNNRVESHSNFQAFFEGVLTSRRTVSQNSPAPLNLRANLEFTPSANLRDGVINVVRFIRADGVQKANIVIDPPALGRISVELTSSSSGVEASIKVSSEQIRQLVQGQINQLRMNLSEQGVQVANFTVDVQQDNQQGQGRNQNNNPYYNSFNGAEDDSDLETEEFRIDLEDGLLYWVA